MKNLKKITVATLVLLILAVTLIQTLRAEKVDFTARELMPAFLSDVVGLDLTKYDISHESYSFDYPSYYGGNFKEETITFNLDSTAGNIRIMCIFLNGFNGGIFVYQPTNGSMFFKQQPSTNALDESRNMLQRYRTFAENYGLETSHIDQALIMMNDATGASSASADLNMFNKVTGFVPSVVTAGNMKQETKEDSIKWSYVDGGVEMPKSRF